MVAKECFGSVLVPYGFTHEGSKRCTFHRQAPDSVFHFIAPAMSIGQTRYYVYVFLSHLVFARSLTNGSLTSSAFRQTSGPT
jgi:hypothetical protein